jgi:hypothetical protein
MTQDIRNTRNMEKHTCEHIIQKWLNFFRNLFRNKKKSVKMKQGQHKQYYNTQAKQTLVPPLGIIVDVFLPNFPVWPSFQIILLLFSDFGTPHPHPTPAL